jgi:hypothetical protein
MLASPVDMVYMRYRPWSDLPCGNCGHPLGRHFQFSPCPPALPGYPTKAWLAWHPRLRGPK